MTGPRAVFSKMWHGLSARSRAAEAANARRAARCAEANEPQIANNPYAPAAIDSVTVPAFVTSSPSLAADLRAPSRHPDDASPAHRRSDVATMLQNILVAVRKLRRTVERPHHASGRRATTLHTAAMRDPYLTPPNAENENPDRADLVTRADRKRAIR